MGQHMGVAVSYTHLDVYKRQEEADQLSMNTEQLQAYIEAQQTMEEAAALQELSLIHI